jgi:hypothetical protein
MMDRRQERRFELRMGCRVLLVIAFLGTVFAAIAGAQETGQKTFRNPADASKALYDAAKAGDQAGLVAVLGASSKSITSSGDHVQDQKSLDSFLSRYEQMNRWGRETNGDQTLFVGAENWPFPIPLKKNAAGQWYFDTKAGAQEILYRRVGRNEYAAIRVCDVLASAQTEYFGQLHDGDTVHQYAQKVLSDPGKQNGLFWKVAEGEPESPVGPLIGYAASEGYKEKSEPFHGYFFRVLTSQGAKAPGGAKNYILDGKMTGGFAFLAYPAEYRNSGVMTFVVDKKGVIYEKDLGSQTVGTASAITSFNADATWRKLGADAEDEAEGTGSE